MEWASQWHGPEGKVHADKRTVEYTGRGNHSADAVSFVGAMSVGKDHSQRTRREDLDRVTRTPCLASPLDGAAPKSGINGAVSGGDAVGDASSATHSAGGGDDETPRSETKKNKHRGNGKASASACKKRRVGYGTKLEGEGSGDEDRVRELLRLPVYYFEIHVLATKYFQGDPGGRPHASDRHHQDNDDGGDDDSEMKEGDGGDDDDSDDVAMEADLAVSDSDAPWRGRARRFIHEHLRATSEALVSTTHEGGGGSASSGSAIRHNGSGSDGAIEIASAFNGNGDTSGVLRRSLSHHINGNGSGATGASRLVRSTSSNVSPPSPPPLTHQQLLLSFPLSSSTIHQIRLRLERQQQQTQSHRRRSSSSSGTTESGSVSVISAIANIHARHRRETVRRKRSNHRIAVGFMFSKHGGDYKRDICHDELGRQACGIALVGKTGEVISNGQTFLQTDVRFGHGDTIGCGVILDTRTFFWTVNGRLAATIPVSDVHHLDDFEEHSVGHEMNETEWFTAWADQLLPSVSLHEHGESVRALFTETSTERFRFDLDAFQQHQLKHRQTTLMAYAGAKAVPGAPRAEEEIMHQLVEDYFVHFGYGNALSALHDLHQGTHTRNTHSRASESVALRHTVRQSIYAFNTREALRHIGSQVTQLSAQDPMILLHCHILCVVDILYDAYTTKRKYSSADAIRAGQEILHEYLSGADEHAERLEEIRAFMSVLLYPSVDEIPDDCPGRRFLIWPFREEVVDALNDALSSTTSEPCALEKLVDDLSELQRECLSCGASPFPLDENSHHGARFPRGHKRDHDPTKRLSLRSEEDSDGDNDDDSHSSSSAESEDDEDDDDE